MPSPTPGSYVFPLKASANGRYMVDQIGQPFFMVGGSPQNLAALPITTASHADATTYLATRAAQGFNSVQVYCFPWDFGAAGSAGNHTPLLGGNGTYPFKFKIGGGAYTGVSGTADFSSFNTAYFDYLDQILDLTVQYGFFVHLYVIDYGYGGDGSQGWWPDVKANSTAALQGLGTFLGNRYKNRTNIMWIDGSDYGQSSPNPPDAANENKVVALIEAMQAAGANQLRSGDWNSPSISTDEPLFTRFTQVNGIYSYGSTYPSSSPNNGVTYPESRVAWNYAPTLVSQGNPGATSIPLALPAFEKETDYEGSGFSPGDAASVRRAQWWSVLSGGTAGFFFENESVLRYVSGWQNTDINSAGALDAKRLAELMQSFSWWKLVPSELSGMRRLVTTSNGSQVNTPADYVAAAQTSDFKTLIAYIPPSGNSSQNLTVDLGPMASSLRARWWDPTSGGLTTISGIGGGGSHAFTTPGANSGGANDWVLLIDTP